MKYYFKKIAGLVITMFLVSLATFAVFQLMPQNPAEIILGVNAEPEQIIALEKELQLNLPPLTRYFNWIKNLFKGDLGMSYRYHQPVSGLISSAFGVTAGLSVLSILLTILIGIPMGIFLSMKHSEKTAVILSVISQMGLSIPSFCIGIMLISVFSVWLKLVPSMGYTAFSVNPIEYLKTMILPSVAISIGSSAILMRYVKVCIENEKQQPYVKTARSKGFSQSKILKKHILRNSLVPAITMLGMLVADILGGSIIIENVFSLPGIGKLIATSIATRDLPLIQGLVLYLAVIVVICNFLVDMLYSLIDPRIRVK
ncbi:MAG: ABC transporter permease [Oscillospiraceae bacterium]